MNRRGLGKVILCLSTLVLTLSACAVYEPVPEGYAYPTYYYPGYAYAPGYAYGPAYGSVYVGGGWGWHGGGGWHGRWR